MGCCNSDDYGGEPNHSTRNVIILGISLCVSFGLLLAAGLTPPGDWIPMVNLIAVLLVPVAVILTDTIGGGGPFAEYNEGRAAWANFGTCFFGVILTSLFGLPLILYHVNKLTSTGLGLWLASTIVTFAASIWYWISRTKGQLI